MPTQCRAIRNQAGSATGSAERLSTEVACSSRSPAQMRSTHRSWLLAASCEDHVPPERSQSEHDRLQKIVLPNPPRIPSTLPRKKPKAAPQVAGVERKQSFVKLD